MNYMFLANYWKEILQKEKSTAEKVKVLRRLFVYKKTTKNSKYLEKKLDFYWCSKGNA
jgi:hypothetical protein